VREKRQLVPTDLGLMVNDLLVSKLDALFNVGFTAEMEDELDHVEEGRVEWTQMMGDFYKRFTQWMEQAKEPPADLEKVMAVLAMLNDVTVWAPEVQRGKRKYSDERFVSSVREQLEKGEKPVTDKQVEALARIALNYRDQIPNVESTLVGLGYSELIDADKSLASTEDSAARFGVLDGVKLSESQASFVNSLRTQAERGRKLSEKQIAALERIIAQNASQIENFETVRDRLGLSVDAQTLEPDHESPVLLNLLSHVSTWQEPVKRGKMVFDDHAFLDSLREQFDRQKALSPRQRNALRRMLFRYKTQIPDFEKHAESLGLTKKAKSENAE